MKEKYNWIKRKQFFARIFLAVGLLIALAGITMEVFKVVPGYDPRLITSAGILLLGISFSNWLRVYLARKDPEAAIRTINTEFDERLTLIRSRGGNRSFWVSISLTYSLLMWESISSNGSLPLLSDNARWFWLAAAVVIPMITYITSILYDESHF